MRGYESLISISDLFCEAEGLYIYHLQWSNYLLDTWILAWLNSGSITSSYWVLNIYKIRCNFDLWSQTGQGLLENMKFYFVLAKSQGQIVTLYVTWWVNIHLIYLWKQLSGRRHYIPFATLLHRILWIAFCCISFDILESVAEQISYFLSLHFPAGVVTECFSWHFPATTSWCLSLDLSLLCGVRGCACNANLTFY